jgi:hypothetical protein
MFRRILVGFVANIVAHGSATRAILARIAPAPTISSSSAHAAVTSSAPSSSAA